MRIETIHACLRAYGMELVECRETDHQGVTGWRVVSDRWAGDRERFSWGHRFDDRRVTLAGACTTDSIEVHGGTAVMLSLWASAPELASLAHSPTLHTEADLMRWLGLLEQAFDRLTLTQHRKTSAWMTEKERAALEGAAQRHAKTKAKAKAAHEGQGVLL